jgi:hypothetical protein
MRAFVKSMMMRLCKEMMRLSKEMMRLSKEMMRWMRNTNMYSGSQKVLILILDSSITVFGLYDIRYGDNQKQIEGRGMKEDLLGFVYSR